MKSAKESLTSACLLRNATCLRSYFNRYGDKYIMRLGHEQFPSTGSRNILNLGHTIREALLK